MSEDSAVRRVVAGWLARGHLTGMSEEELRTLAAVAAQAMGSPQTWDTGEVVPRGVDIVLDDRGLRWARDFGPSGNGVWICYAPERDLTGLVGPVTEDVGDQPETLGPAQERDCLPGECQGCGVSPGDVHLDDCPNRLPMASKTNTVPDTAEQTNTVVLERAALVGLRALLETVAAKLTRVRATYKGPAVKHADTIADECTKAATLLRDVAGDSGG